MSNHFILIIIKIFGTLLSDKNERDCTFCEIPNSFLLSISSTQSVQQQDGVCINLQSAIIAVLMFIHDKYTILNN